jgi:hypothetical protein
VSKISFGFVDGDDTLCGGRVIVPSPKESQEKGKVVYIGIIALPGTADDPRHDAL